MRLICYLFFFQAEDGIRDLVRSRGLGDVYKRQASEPGSRGGGRAPGEDSRVCHGERRGAARTAHRCEVCPGSERGGARRGTAVSLSLIHISEPTRPY